MLTRTPFPVAPDSRRPAFTLVELLVVIGIIALLLSILLPALGKARQQSYSVKCQSNLRQIGLAFVIYMNDSKGFLLPLEYPNDPANPNATHAYWTDVLTERKYLKVGLDNGQNPFMCPSGNQNLPDMSTMFNPGDKDRYTDDGFFAVPGPTYDTNRADHKSVSHYALNGTNGTNLVSGNTGGTYQGTERMTEIFPFVFNHTAAELAANGGALRYPNIFKVKNSTKVPLVFDGIWMHGQCPEGILLRHGKTSSKRPTDRWCNMVFIDGHVESVLGTRLPSDQYDVDHNGAPTRMGMWLFPKKNNRLTSIADGSAVPNADAIQFSIKRFAN